MSKDAIVVLTQDHREVEQLFVLAESAFADPVRLKELTDQVTVELVRHSVAEEELLYPFAKEHLPGGALMVAASLGDHATFERMLKELEGMRGDSVEFGRTLRSLMTEVRAHVLEEEGELFPLLTLEATREELRELGEQLTRARHMAPTRPHPLVPDTLPRNTVPAPGPGLVDRLRDTLSGRAGTPWH